MRSRNARLFRTIVGLALAAAVLPSCGGGGGSSSGGPNDSFNRQALLTHIGTDMVVPAYQDFVVKAQALAAAADAYENEALADGPNEATLRTAVQDAWKAAMLSWETAELFSFGPAGASSFHLGGQDFRDEIYCWTFNNPCLVDQELANVNFAANFASTGYLDAKNVNVSGLAAIEYLLFYDPAADLCSPTGLSLNDREDRRATYAKIASDLLVLKAQGLLNAWTSLPTNFLAKLNNAAGSGVFPSAHAAVNEVFAALFYIDLFCKDKKLSHPAGLNGAPVNVELVESPWANTSIPQLQKNLETFEIIFLGNRPGDPDGIGFDDFLIARGGSALAASMTADIAAARTAANAITSATLKDAINDIPPGSNAAVVALHAAIKKITDAMKGQFVTILNLSVPQTGAGDND